MVADESLNTSKSHQYSIADVMVGSIDSIKKGKILIEVENRPTIDIRASKSNEVKRIDVDILEPEVFNILKNNEIVENSQRKDYASEDGENRLIDSGNNSVEKFKDKIDMAKEFFHLFTDAEASIFDQLKIAKEFAVRLSDNNITIVLRRKGKEAIIMGKDANPSISKIISRSDDLQIKSVTESSKLISEIGTTLADDNNDTAETDSGKKKK